MGVIYLKHDSVCSQPKWPKMLLLHNKVQRKLILYTNIPFWVSCINKHRPLAALHSLEALLSSVFWLSHWMFVADHSFSVVLVTSIYMLICILYHNVLAEFFICQETRDIYASYQFKILAIIPNLFLTHRLAPLSGW